MPVFFSPTWLLLAAFITFFYAEEFVPVGTAADPRAYALSFGVAVMLALSVLAHEISHSIVALRLGLPVRRVTILFVGGISEIEREPQTPAREYLIAVAGPLTSLFLAGVGVAVSQGTSGTVAKFAVIGALVNGIVGVLNLLPGLPLDGGRVLRAVIWKLSSDPLKGTTASAWAGRGLAALVLLVPLVRSAADPSRSGGPQAYDVIWAALVAAFIWSGATADLRRAQLRRRLPKLRLRWLVRSALPVTADVSVAEAVRRARETGAGALVVIDSDGRPEALVPEAAVAGTPPQRQPWLGISALAQPLAPEQVLDADLEGEALLDAVQRSPASDYLVVEATGAVLGVLAVADLAKALQDA